MTSEWCGVVYADCICEVIGDHEAHVCACGGSWFVEEDGRFRVVAWPGGRTDGVEALMDVIDRFLR